MTPRPFLPLVLLLFTGDAARCADKPVQCANLIYGGVHTSRCFSDEFLASVQAQTGVATERRFKAVKLDSDELFQFPFVLITGEQDFVLTSAERANLKKYCENGGFLLSSAGCSNKAYDEAFRREMRVVFGEKSLAPIPMTHPVFNTVTEIKEFNLKHPEPDARLEGCEFNGKLVVIHSPHGLNDTGNSEGCCCCGGNEIINAIDINLNILIYALCH